MERSSSASGHDQYKNMAPHYVLISYSVAIFVNIIFFLLAYYYLYTVEPNYQCPFDQRSKYGEGACGTNSCWSPTSEFNRNSNNEEDFNDVGTEFNLVLTLFFACSSIALFQSLLVVVYAFTKSQGLLAF